MTKVNVIGAGGHARSVLPILLQNGLAVAGVYDEGFREREEIFPGIYLLGGLAARDPSLPTVFALGDNLKRKTLFETMNAYQHTMAHASAFIDPSASLGEANVVGGQALVNGLAKLGSNNIVNSGAIIEHECEIGSHNHISIHATVGGRAKIGDLCFLGASSTVIDRVRLGDGVMLGAGAVATADILDPGVYVGIPARRIR